jgi:hypothetical protein
MDTTDPMKTRLILSLLCATLSLAAAETTPPPPAAKPAAKPAQ